MFAPSFFVELTSATITFLVSIIGSALLFADQVRTRAVFVTLLASFSLTIAICTTKLALPPIAAWFFIGISRGIVEGFTRKSRKIFLLTLEKRISIVDELILTLKTGSSVRWSLILVSKNGAIEDRAALEAVLKHFQQGGEDAIADRELAQFVTRLRGIASSENKIIERMENWRFEMKLHEEFRRRSRQSSLQARVQIVFCAALFIPAAGWNLFLEGSASGKRLILAAILIFLAGVWMKTIIEGFRWRT